MSTPHESFPSDVDEYDVEGHGMKEVAIGLSAATIVASGVGAILSADDGTPGGSASAGRGTVGATQRLAAAAQQDAAAALRMSQAAADRAAQTGVTAISPISQHAQSVLDETAAGARTAATGAVDDVNRVADDPMAETDRLVDAAMKDVRELRDQTLQTAKDAAGTATTTARNLTETADREARTAVQTTQREAKRALQTAKNLTDQEVGAKASHSGGSTTVRITAAGYTAEVQVN